MPSKKRKTEPCPNGHFHVRFAAHECPYQADVNNNPDPKYCKCCDDCRTQCADDI